MKTVESYEAAMGKCPRRCVSDDDFRTAAIAAGWQLKTITLLLREPMARYEMKVGRERLVISNGKQ